MCGITGHPGWVITLRTDWIAHDDMAVVLRLLMPANSLVVEVCLTTGLRISDALSLTSEQVRKGQRVTVVERKTGKSRRIYLNKQLHRRLLAQAGRKYVFEGRNSPDKPRTRQAVWLDLKRAAKALRIDLNLAPHSARKIYAVQIFREQGLVAAQKALNHDRPETTLLYVLSDIIRGHL